MAERTLSHFAYLAFSDHYWSLAGSERAELARTWLPQLRDGAENVEIYQVFPAQSGADILVWSALQAESEQSAAGFFSCFARATNAQRRLLRPVETLWGFTRPSQYARGQSAQEIDPFEGERKPYLIVYPFVKTKEWYLMSRDARQGMMNEHIRVGHQYPEIKQLLLYSFGLAAEEFVVVYETADLPMFSDLVNELRSVEGRRYTERDTPAHTSIYHRAEETLALFGSEV
jgi:chlorite dismutase